jgi:hypothetical protein
VAGEKPGRPQFMRITQVFVLSARQRYQPCLGFERDRGLLAGTGAIVQCSHRAFGHGPLNAALDRLMMQAGVGVWGAERHINSNATLNPQEHVWEEIREIIFKNHAAKSMREVSNKLVKAALYIERYPNMVKSMTSFPYIMNSL